MGIGGFVLVAVMWSVALAALDIAYRRLPDPLTIPPAIAALAGCVIHPPLVWGLIWPGLYLLVGKGIGGGDIKLAVPLGVVCAATGGPTAVLTAIALSGLLTGTVTVIRRVQDAPHGPSMLAAAWAVGAACGV